MAIRKVSSQLIEATQEEARKFKEMKPLAGERILKPSRLKFLLDHIESKTFIGPEWAQTTIKGSDELYRCNGQHSATVLADLPPEKFAEKFSDGLPLATVTTFEIDSVAEDARTLFDSFDNPKSKRDNIDMLGVDVATFAELDEISRTSLALVAKGIDFAYRQDNEELDRQRKKARDAGKEFRPTREKHITYSTRDQGNYFNDPTNRQFADWVNLLMSTKDQTSTFIFKIPGVVAAMLADWQKSPDLAQDFWMGVLTPDPLPEGEVAKDLAQKLRNWYANPKGDKKSQEQFNKEARKMSNWYYKAKKQIAA